ncbi:MAG: flavodoxin-dependent (E)-4-hydroxy-3-methylbut-2-enyl-diphosphate synthase [Clostridiales bacterium]|nr:flavodoxin-dependent (E)-4-hydroxy-3-methylbut-2-enyl-diphosphate synthase [Clostridiales bacterium]
MGAKNSIYAGKLKIGGGAQVSVQSMTNTDTRDRDKTLDQIKALSAAGCDLVRFSVYDEICAQNVRYLADHSPVPLCADIHFDADLAVKSIENGIHKLRINPGNIGNRQEILRVVDAARMHRVPIRIGVNAGSLEKDLREKHGSDLASAMVESALRHVKILEDEHFYDMALSLKASDVMTTVKAYRSMARVCDYPLHVGVTEAGLPGMGTVKSAIGIGSLLLDGIGDTIRVSLTGDPVEEPKAALEILRALRLRHGVQFVSCPTCGRTQIDVPAIAKKVQDAFMDVDRDITVAVMGCVVNGPGEAKGADVALCGGKDCAALYVKGQFIRKITGDIASGMIEAVRGYLNDV